MTTQGDWDKYTKPSDSTLLTVCLGDIAMSNISDGDKAVVDAAIRVVKREAKLRERLAKMALDMEQDCDARAWAQDIEALLKEGS